jgi:hypothetical protein
MFNEKLLMRDLRFHGNEMSSSRLLTPCSIVVGYQHLRGPCHFHLQGEVSGVWIEIQVEFLWTVMLYSASSGIVGMVRSRGVGWAGCIA